MQEVSQILRQLVDAVGFCNSKGVVHRDIKPENVLSHCGEGAITAADGDNVPNMFKLTDFGLAKVLPPEGLLFASSGSESLPLL